MNIIFDTNAYRVLSYKLRSLSEKDKQVELKWLKLCEAKKGFTTKINIWVLCEILNHLCKLNDPGYKCCSETLKFMLQHSGGEAFTHMFHTHLAHKFNCTEIAEYYKDMEVKIFKLAREFDVNGRSEKFEKSICDIPKLIEDYKRQRLEGFIDATNTLRDDGCKKISIDDEYLHGLVLRSMVKGYLDHELEPTFENNIKLHELNNNHYLGIARTIKVLKKGFRQNLNKEKFSKNFMDEILCCEIGKSNDTILITDDGKTKEGIITTFKEKGYPEKTMELDKYLRFIGYSLPPPTVYE